MKLSDLFDYLHLKQTLISRAIRFSSGADKRKLQNSLKHYLRLEDNLNTLCEAVYFFSLGQDNEAKR